MVGESSTAEVDGCCAFVDQQVRAILHSKMMNFVIQNDETCIEIDGFWSSHGS